MATVIPASRWSSTNLVLVVKACIATSALSSTMGIKLVMRCTRGWASQISGMAWPMYLMA